MYNKVILEEYEQYSDIKETLEKEFKEYNKKEKNAEIKLFMIIELTSSTIYNSILNDFPTSIDCYKPILFEQIKNIIK